MKHDDGAAAQIAEQLERSGLEKVTLNGVRPVEEAIRSFRARLARMDYAGARRRGLPIGSGNVEAMCKSLVTVRMKWPGARWKHTTGEEVLQLRALQLSDRWAPAVQRATKPLAKPVQIARGLVATARTKPVPGGQGARAARGGIAGADRRHRAGARTAQTRLGAVTPDSVMKSKY